jgi:hypothetical protein
MVGGYILYDFCVATGTAISAHHLLSRGALYDAGFVTPKLSAPDRVPAIRRLPSKR